MGKRRASGDGTLRKRTDGRWEGRIIVGHRQNGTPLYQCFLGKTQKEVLRCMGIFKENPGVGMLNEGCRITLGEWLDRWLDEIMVHRVRGTTLDKYRSCGNFYIKPYLGKRPVSAVTTVEVQRCYNRLLKEGRVREHKTLGKSLSAGMVRGIHALLHEAFDAAVREHMAVKNPTEGVTLPKVSNIERTPLTDRQVEIFLRVIRDNPIWGDLFYTEIMTGLRRGEICGL